jgi:hypothetical protein
MVGMCRGERRDKDELDDRAAGRVAVVSMSTNKVNAQNRAFFADLHEAFDTLEREHAESPVVLTGTDGRFSAGLDLDEHFRLFARDRAAVAAWFGDYRATNVRLFTYPRPTVAAVNGHAYAGGLITAAVCDYRVAVSDGARFGLNEVPIGNPDARGVRAHAPNVASPPPGCVRSYLRGMFESPNLPGGLRPPPARRCRRAWTQPQPRTPIGSPGHEEPQAATAPHAERLHPMPRSTGKRRWFSELHAEPQPRASSSSKTARSCR